MMVNVLAFRTVLALSPLLLACSPQPVGGAAAEPSGIAQVEGRYLVAFVDGAPPVIGIAGSEPTVMIQENRIHFQSQCIYADWTFTLQGETLNTRDHYEPGSAMCARGLAPGETAIQQAIGAAKRVRQIRGGLYLDGGQGNIQLRRLPDPRQAASRAVDLTGEWRVMAIDGQAFAETRALTLSVDWNGIWWEPGCAGQSVSYRINGTRFTAEPFRPPAGAVCDIGIPPELPQVWSALAAAETIMATGKDVRIAGGGRSVALSRR